MKHTKQSINTEQLVEIIGRKELRQALGVHNSQITGAIKRNRFHANWFLAVAELADRKGLNTQTEAFCSLFPMRKILD